MDGLQRKTRNLCYIQFSIYYCSPFDKKNLNDRIAPLGTLSNIPIRDFLKPEEWKIITKYLKYEICSVIYLFILPGMYLWSSSYDLNFVVICRCPSL